MADEDNINHKGGRAAAIGGEYDVCKYLTARAGSWDSQFTWGATAKYDRLALDYSEVDSSGMDGKDKALGVRYGYSW